MHGDGQQVSGAHGIAYGVCRLRPSLYSMIWSAVVARCPCSGRCVVWHGVSRHRPSLSAMIRSAVVTRRHVLRPRRCLWLSAPPHTPVWGYRKDLPPAGDVIGAAFAMKNVECIMKNETVVQGCHTAAALLGECDESAGIASGRTSVFNAQLRIQNGV